MKNKILQGAADNIYRYGLKKFTVDSICNELKISKKTVYKYFSSKDELVKEYFRQTLDSDKESTLNSLREDIPLEEKIKKIIFSYHKYKIPAKILQETKLYYPEEWMKLNELREFKVASVVELLEAGKEKGIISKDVDLKLVSFIIDVVSNELLSNENLHYNDKNLYIKIDQVLNIILNGIRKSAQ